MSSQNDTGCGSITLSATVGQHLRVTAVGGLAGDAADVGTAREDGVSGDVVGIFYRNKQGTTQMVASKAIAVGDVVSSVAGGKVTDAAGVVTIGIAMTASTANNDVIEVQRFG